MKRNPKVYLASKLHHAEMAKELILGQTAITFTNRWQFFEGEIPDTEEHAQNFWENDFDDVDACDFVLVFGRERDVLKGALVEAGYGIAKGKQVICVGSSNSFGTWQYSSRVRRFDTMELALDFIRVLPAVQEMA